VALVGAAGVYDLSHWARNADHPIADDARQALAGAADADLRERSPVHVAAQLRCPVRLIHGGKDDVVPPEQAELMAAALRAAGNEPDLLIYPERSHSSLASPPFVDFLAEQLKR
jgi:dipeptidyl aminopeptidase/acylaminoacyl peptidase